MRKIHAPAFKLFVAGMLAVMKKPKRAKASSLAIISVAAKLLTEEKELFYRICIPRRTIIMIMIG